MGREKRGMGLWGVRDPGVFFIWFQQVLNSVLLDSRKYALKVFPSGSSRSYFDLYGFPPSPSDKND